MVATYTKSNNGSRVVVHENANSIITVVGNNSVSNLTSNSSEVVVNAVINKVWFGSQGGTWIVGRGNSTVNSVVGVFSGNGRADFDEGGTSLSVAKDGTNMYLTLLGTANGYIMVDLRKNV